MAPTGAKVPAPALASTGSVSANVPFTSRPGATALGSATVSAASPAEEMTLAVVDDV